jgi:hypothetical protein
MTENPSFLLSNRYASLDGMWLNLSTFKLYLFTTSLLFTSNTILLAFFCYVYTAQSKALILTVSRRIRAKSITISARCLTSLVLSSVEMIRLVS